MCPSNLLTYLTLLTLLTRLTSLTCLTPSVSSGCQVGYAV